MKLLQSHLSKIDKNWLINLKKSDDNMTPLHLAALNNHTDIIKCIINMDGVDANAKCLNNQTPLHFAVARLNYDACEALLNRELYMPGTKAVDVNIQDVDGHTPFHCLMLAYSIANFKKVCQISSKVINVSIYNSKK